MFILFSGIGAGVVGDQTTDEIINEVDWDNMVDSDEDNAVAADEDGEDAEAEEVAGEQEVTGGEEIVHDD